MNHEAWCTCGHNHKEQVHNIVCHDGFSHKSNNDILCVHIRALLMCCTCQVVLHMCIQFIEGEGTMCINNAATQSPTGHGPIYTSYSWMINRIPWYIVQCTSTYMLPYYCFITKAVASRPLHASTHLRTTVQRNASQVSSFPDISASLCDSKSYSFK